MKKILWCLLTLVLFCNNGFSQNLNVIEKELQEVLNQKNDELVSVSIVFKSQINSAKLKAKAEKKLDKSTRKEFVIDELKEFSSKSQADVLSFLKAEEKGGKVSDINSLWIVNMISCDASRDVIYKLSSHPDIKMLSYNKEVQLLEREAEMAEVDDVQETRGGMAAPHVLQVNADDVWNQGYTGRNVVVAVLDSGSNINHYDLKDHLWIGYADTDADGVDDVINGWNFVDKSSDVRDNYAGVGHGTHCAGIVCGDGTVGNTVGIAPDALLMTVKIVNRAGGGTVDQMLSGVQFAVENGADVLSMSLGFKGKDLSSTQKETIRMTFEQVLNADVVVCAAAGNDGTTIGVPYNVDYPAACPAPWLHPDQKKINEGGLSSVICVGSVNSNNNHVSSSSEGPSTWEDYPYDGTSTFGLIRPDISAPGDLVYSLKYNENDKYKYLSGTSQATPCVAGVIALMLEKNPNLTPAEICEIIETTASNKPVEKNNQIGSGVVDALNAVNAVNASSGSPFVKLTHFSPKSIVSGNNTLNVTITNEGNGVSENTNATLTTSDEYVTITNANVSLGNIGAKSSVNAEFTINVSSNVPNGHTASLLLTTTDGSFTWRDAFSIKINSSPIIVYQSSSTGVINAGEETQINVVMKNKGTAATVQNTDVSLSSNSQYVDVRSGNVTLGPMNINEEKNASFSVYVNPDILDKESIMFTLQANPDNNLVARNITYEFEQEIDEYGFPTDGFNGWTTFDNSPDGRNHPWLHTSEYATHNIEFVGGSQSGMGHMASETYCNGSMSAYTMPIDNFLVSPKIKATANSKITFFARAHDGFVGERFYVSISEASNNVAEDFKDIIKYQLTNIINSSVWKEYTLDLKDYAGKEIYVAFRHHFTEQEWANCSNGMDTYMLHIDDVTFYDVIDLSEECKNNNKSYFNVLVNSNPLSAPGNLKAVANGISSITLSWDAVAKAKSYNIYRDGVYIKNVGKETTSYTDANLAHNTEYCYEVAAVGNIEYEHSEQVCATTDKKDYSANVRFSPQTIEVDGETTVAMNLTIVNDGKKEFKARSTYTLTCNDNTYVTISNNTGNVKLLQPDEEISVTVTVKVDENIPDNYVLNFNLNLLSMVTNPSQPEYFTFDVPFEVPVSNPLRVPENVRAKNIGANSVTLGWDASSKATSYNIYRDGELVSNTTSTIFFDNNLEKETMYCYKVTSVAASEESDFSQEVCVTTLAEDNGILVQSYELIDQGTTTIIRATLINRSNAVTSETATATLTCEDEYVTIVDGVADLASLAVGEAATVEFSIKISNNVPAEHNVAFNIVVETEGEDIGDLEYTFDSGFEGWTNYIKASNPTWEWEYEPNKQCITSYSYKGSSRTPDNLICSPIKIKVSENTQVIWDVASSASSYYAEHYAVYLISVDPVSTDGWESFPNPIFEKTLTSEYAGYKFKTETASASSEAGNEMWVVFRHFDCKDQNSILVDNIKITNVLVPAPVYYYNMINITANPPSPVGLTATADGANTVNLLWNEVDKAEYYNIYRDGEYIANTAATSYSDNNLTHNTTYCYEVTAVNEGSEYAHSGDVCVTTTKKDYNVIVEFATQTIDVEGETTAAISFTVLNDGRYDFEASYTLTCEDNAYVSIANNTDYISVSPEEEVAKTIYVTISENVPDDYVFDFNLNLLSLVTDSSQPGYFTFDFPFEVVANNPLRIPENLTVTDIGLYFVALEWDAAIGAVSYNVYRNGEFVANTNETNYLDENLNPETRYCYKVTNVTSYAESDFSEEVCATTLEEEKGILVQSYDLSAGVGQATLTVTLINRSEAATTATTTASISCEDQYVTIVSATDMIGSFAIGETATAEFSVILDENIPSGYNIDFGIAVEYESDGGGYTNVNCAFGSDLSGCTTLTKDDHNWYHSNEQSAHGYNKKYTKTPSGMGFVFSESYCNTSGDGFDPEHLIILPEQVVPSATTKIEFYACSMSSYTKYAGETFGVFVSTTNNTSIDSFEEVYKWTLANKESSLEMAKKTADLSKYKGKKVWVAIKHCGSGENAALAIDDITVNNVKVSSTVTYEKTFTVTVNKSNAVNMFSGTGSWTDASKWSYGSTPTASDDVVIDGDVTIESCDVVVKSLTINNEKTLTVKGDATLTVNGKFVSAEPSSLLIYDGAQIYQSNENVAATYYMNIENPTTWLSANKTGWQFISSPLKNAAFTDYVPGADEGEYDLYMFDGSRENEWVNYKSSATMFGAAFKQGRAYMASYETKEIAEFTGYLNHENSFTFDIPYQYEGGEFKDFFLLGNPFTFDISLSDFDIKGMLNDYAYITSDGSYKYSTPNSTIKVGDGFFMKASASLGTNLPSVKVVKNAKGRSEKIRFINVVAQNNQGSDNVVVKFDGSENEGFPKLENINTSIANVYVVDNNNRYGAISFDDDVTEIPLCFEAKQMGNYTISIENNADFEDVVLVDRLTGIETNMSLEDKYSFTASNNDNFNRFIIKIVKRIEKSDIFAHQNGSELIVDAEGLIQIIDIMGRMVYSNDVESTNNRIDVSNLKGSTYIIRNVSDNGIRIQKIVIL